MVDMKKYGKPVEVSQSKILGAVAEVLAAHPDLTVPLPNGKTISNEDAVAYLRDRSVAAANKNKGSGNQTPRQVENEGYKAALLALMREKTAENADFKATVTQLFKALNDRHILSDDMTTNRLSAIIQQLYNREDAADTSVPVLRVVEKRVAYFKLNPDYQAPEAEVEGGEE